MKGPLNVIIMLTLFLLVYPDIQVAAKGLEEQMPIKQEAFAKKLLTESEYTIPVNGGVITAALLPTVTAIPEVEFDEDWLKLKDIEKDINGNYNLKFETTPNTYVSGRIAEISVKANGTTEILTISQEENIAAPDKSGMEADAIQLVSGMTMGWNLGNTLEAIGGETYWGNPVTAEDMIVKIKGYGYNAVRLPCAWDQYLENQTSYKIKDSWMSRVKDVVDYCINNDMYVILNIHWDGGWLENNCTPDKQAAVNIKQNALWEQIAVHFRDYDERLLFAGCNEPNAKNAEQAEVLRSYEQTFIDAVRRSGGRNAYRNLIVPSPETNIGLAKTIMKLPEDAIPNRMILEVHYYDPFNFCIMDKDESWGKMAYFWGKGYEQYAVGEYEGRFSTWGLEDHVLEQFKIIKQNFTDKGIPSILGEFGAARRRFDDPKIQLSHDQSRGYFYQIVTEQAKNNGVVPFIWEIGGVFDRRNNMRVTDPEVYNGMVRGAMAGKYPY